MTELSEHQAASQDGGLVPLDVVDPITLQGCPIPQREWLIPGWIPWGAVTALYGDGGTGKSLIAQMLLTAAGTGGEWLGLNVRPCKVLAVFCEDNEAELHIRQADINRHYGVDFCDLENVRWVSRLGFDNLMMMFDSMGKGVLTPFYFQILNFAREMGAQLIIIDTAADTFGGNENDRHEVRTFLSAALARLARGIDGAVVLCAHPSKSGRQSGDGDGGSTQWNNGVRSRLYLERVKTEGGEPEDEDLRTLSRKKANYVRRGDEITLRWQDGTFVVERPAMNGMVESIERRNAGKAFLECLGAIERQGRHVTDAKNSPRYAPKFFAGMPEAKGFRRRDLEFAMNDLFNTGQIRIGEAKGEDRHSVRKIMRVKNA